MVWIIPLLSQNSCNPQLCKDELCLYLCKFSFHSEIKIRVQNSLILRLELNLIIIPITFKTEAKNKNVNQAIIITQEEFLKYHWDKIGNHFFILTLITTIF